ncbi:HYC_CC_PP family protein [Sediminicola luteus]|nr:hypothetical protein [Sediminicola luteus]
MKAIFKNIATFLMTLLVLVSTVSFTVDKHYCLGRVIDTALFAHAEGCGMEMEANDKEGCCKNTQEVVEGQDELKMSVWEDLDFPSQQFLVAYTYTLPSRFEPLAKKAVPFQNYKPPLLVVDIQLLDAVFLI